MIDSLASKMAISPTIITLIHHHLPSYTLYIPINILLQTMAFSTKEERDYLSDKFMIVKMNLGRSLLFKRIITDNKRGQE